MGITGSCHCGSLTFLLNGRCDEAGFLARVCPCRVCFKHSAAWVADPRSSLELIDREWTLSTGYRFGSRSAEFHVCSKCGVVVAATSRLGGTTYATVNANTFEDLEPSRLRLSSFDPESVDIKARLMRRKRQWIPDVSMIRRRS